MTPIAERLSLMLESEYRQMQDNGFEFPPPDYTHPWHDAEQWDIQARVDGLRALYCGEEKPITWSARAEQYLKDRKETIGWIVAWAGVLFSIAKWFADKLFASHLG